MELSDEINTTVIELLLPKEVQNSYVANIKKLNIFIANGQKIPALNQLESFINKVEQDMSRGLISISDGNMLIQMALELIDLLNV